MVCASPRRRRASCQVLALAAFLPAASPAFPAEAAASAADLIATLQPAVVSIETTKNTADTRGSNIAAQPSVTEQKAVGSGFFIDPTGVILTNRHVLADATQIIVTLNDTTRLRASLLASSAHSDLALLKVRAGWPVPTLRFGDSDHLRPGDPVFVVGNPLGFGSTVTSGIVSALDRVTPESGFGAFFQIDAALNKGNSGGPVFDQEGEVVGISTAFLTAGDEGGSVGLGLAIPSDDARIIVRRLGTDGRDALGWIGIQVQPVTAEIASALGVPAGPASIIERVDTDSPAARAGLNPGDIVLKIDDAAAMSPQRLNRQLAEARIGSVVRLAIWRDGTEQALPVAIEEAPGGNAAPAPVAPPVEPSSGHGILGLRLAPLTRDARARLGMAEQEQGALIEAVSTGSVAWDHAVTAASAIVRVDGAAVTSPADALRRIEDAVRRDRANLLLQLRDRQGLRWTVLPLKPA